MKVRLMSLINHRDKPRFGGVSSLISSLTKKKCALGIDIGTRFIKVVQISCSGKGTQVDYYGSISTPPELATNSFQEEMLAAELEKILGEISSKKCPINITLGGNRIITRHIRMPQMPAKELEKSIKWEVEKYLPMPVDELVLDYVNLGTLSSDGQKQQHILVAAIYRETVKKYYQAFSLAKLQISSVDLSAFALWRVFVGINKDFPKDVSAILDIGYSNSQLIVVNDRKISFTRLLPVGARTILDSLARNLHLEHATQALETGDGWSAELEREVAVSKDASLAQQQFWASGISDFCREVRRSLEFYQNQEKVQVTGIVITGGSANLAGIDALLAAELNLPVRVGSVDITIKDRPDQTIAPSYAVALGLALREVVD
ncbi:type IV pilus assembly protein PilM [Desulforamulus ferrireducens]|nr:type IV pilus assembly protein PilM [Desulforamulus ferrireducens]